MIEDKFKSAKVIGLDGDPRILEIARQKINEKNSHVALHKGYSTNIPFEDGRFELVFSSLMLHHLTTEDKRKTLSEVHRVLGENGEILIADWGKPDSAFVRILFLIVQFLDGFKTTKDNVKGLLPEYIKAAGFREAVELNRFPTVLGSISIYKAKK
jgi:ubiquinone/menaquinone biosynthesis C-methylase UbiE